MSASAQSAECARTVYGTVACNPTQQQSDASREYQAYQQQVQQPHTQAPALTGWEWQQSAPQQPTLRSGVDWSIGRPQ